MKKKLVFNIILIFIVFVILIFIFSSLKTIYGIYRTSQNFCENNTLSKEFLVDYESFIYENYYKEERDSKEEQKLKEDENYFFVFGESTPVVIDGYDISFNFKLKEEHDLTSFPDQISKNINYSHKNLASSGSFSHATRDSIRSTLKRTNKTPKFILLYYGHNDYFLPFKYFIELAQRESMIFDNIIKFGYHFDKQTHHTDFYLHSIFNSINHGFLDYNQNCLNQMDEIVLKNYERNTNQIINLINNYNITTIFITPVANLQSVYEHPIHGSNKTFNNYTQKINYLIKLKDNFYFDVYNQVNSEFNNYLRSIENKSNNIYVYDLEKELIEKQFNFSNKEFSDQHHFTNKTHKLVGNLISDYIKKENIIQK